MLPRAFTATALWRQTGRTIRVWREPHLNGATEITLPTKHITPDNVTLLGCPMP